MKSVTLNFALGSLDEWGDRLGLSRQRRRAIEAILAEPDRGNRNGSAGRSSRRFLATVKATKAKKRAPGGPRQAIWGQDFATWDQQERLNPKSF